MTIRRTRQQFLDLVAEAHRCCAAVVHETDSLIARQVLPAALSELTALKRMGQQTAEAIDALQAAFGVDSDPAYWLSCEVERVTEVRCFYRDTVALIPNIDAKPAIASMGAAIRAAHDAAGSGDDDQIRAAITKLEAFTFSAWSKAPDAASQASDGAAPVQDEVSPAPGPLAERGGDMTGENGKRKRQVQ